MERILGFMLKLGGVLILEYYFPILTWLTNYMSIPNNFITRAALLLHGLIYCFMSTKTFQFFATHELFLVLVMFAALLNCTSNVNYVTDPTEKLRCVWELTVTRFVVTHLPFVLNINLNSNLFVPYFIPVITSVLGVPTTVQRIFDYFNYAWFVVFVNVYSIRYVIPVTITRIGRDLIQTLRCINSQGAVRYFESNWILVCLFFTAHKVVITLINYDVVADDGFRKLMVLLFQRNTDSLISLISAVVTLNIIINIVHCFINIGIYVVLNIIASNPRGLAICIVGFVFSYLVQYVPYEYQGIAAKVLLVFYKLSFMSAIIDVLAVAYNVGIMNYFGMEDRNNLPFMVLVAYILPMVLTLGNHYLMQQ